MWLFKKQLNTSRFINIVLYSVGRKKNKIMEWLYIAPGLESAILDSAYYLINMCTFLKWQKGIRRGKNSSKNNSLLFWQQHQEIKNTTSSSQTVWHFHTVWVTCTEKNPKQKRRGWGVLIKRRGSPNSCWPAAENKYIYIIRLQSEQEVRCFCCFGIFSVVENLNKMPTSVSEEWKRWGRWFDDEKKKKNIHMHVIF